VLGCVSAVLIWLTFLLHRRLRRSGRELSSRSRLMFEGLAVLVVGLTAHLGGFLSGMNGA
jgi:hypothetical protein